MVQESVEHADRGGVLGQEPSPGLEGPRRRDAERPVFKDAYQGMAGQPSSMALRFRSPI
jgi:hypothetical protein